MANAMVIFPSYAVLNIRKVFAVGNTQTFSVLKELQTHYIAVPSTGKAAYCV
jgi:hypothetical protein